MRTHHRVIAVLAALALPPACAAPTDSQPGSPEDPADLGSAVSADTTCGGAGPSGYNPYKYAYFGDLHLHTSYSLDAYSFGTRSTPSNAYLFAKGAAVVHVGSGTNAPHGPDITQPRPLDFLAVTDHSEFLAVTHGCTIDPVSGYYYDPRCYEVRSQDPTVQDLVFAGLVGITTDLCGPSGNPMACIAQARSAWVDLKNAANTANDPCHFTSLVAYEWSDTQTVTDPSSGKPKGVTNHRNVIFANDSVPYLPLDSFNYPDPPSLWTGLDNQCTSAMGCDAVTIPHNTNLSSGVSLAVWTPTAAGVSQQQHYQVAAEVYQHKGASECGYDPSTGQNDADCKFEQADPSRTVIPGAANYVRTGLETGIGYAIKHPLQGNPLKMGLVGATDDHNGAPAEVDDANFVGHGGRNDDTALLRLQKAPDFGPGAVTGVWSEQNTRASIFAAVKRKETFATSGPRMRVRFYLTQNGAACSDPLFPKQIIDAGQAVPMGGTFRATDLSASGATFAINVWPDAWPQNFPDGTSGVAGISAVQVIKAHAHLDASGNPVVVEDPPFLVSGIPAAGGCATWTDPSFQVGEYAFYYVRVLQASTWRYSHYDCQAIKQSNPSDWMTLVPGCAPGGGLDVPVQERAWTSPIWYVP
jgi:Protein of unknown function (DUF3604)